MPAFSLASTKQHQFAALVRSFHRVMSAPLGSRQVCWLERFAPVRAAIWRARRSGGASFPSVLQATPGTDVGHQRGPARRRQYVGTASVVAWMSSENCAPGTDVDRAAGHTSWPMVPTVRCSGGASFQIQGQLRHGAGCAAAVHRRGARVLAARDLVPHSARRH
jgi:hypothetical protein